MGDRIRPPYCLEPQGAASGSQIFKISEPTAAAFGIIGHSALQLWLSISRQLQWRFIRRSL